MAEPAISYTESTGDYGGFLLFDFWKNTFACSYQFFPCFPLQTYTLNHQKSRIPNRTARCTELALGSMCLRACVSVARQTAAQRGRSSRSTPRASSVAACVLKGTGASFALWLCISCTSFESKEERTRFQVCRNVCCLCPCSAAACNCKSRCTAQWNQSLPAAQPVHNGRLFRLGKHLQIIVTSCSERGSGPTKHPGTQCKGCEQSHWDPPHVFMDLHPSKNPLMSSTCPAPSSDYTQDAQLQ